LSIETYSLTNTFFCFIFGGMGKLLSSTEAAERLGLSVARVQTFIWEGRLPAVKVGRSYAIDEDDLKLLADRKLGRPPKSAPVADKRATRAAGASNGDATGTTKATKKSKAK
jgi:excisionase family DNA binding protein